MGKKVKAKKSGHLRRHKGRVDSEKSSEKTRKELEEAGQGGGSWRIILINLQEIPGVVKSVPIKEIQQNRAGAGQN
jgi:hypothetical protein